MKNHKFSKDIENIKKMSITYTNHKCMIVSQKYNIL